MKTKLFASYEWRDYYIILPRKINGYWRYFEMVERRRVLRQVLSIPMHMIYEWEYRIKEYNKIPGKDRPFEPGVDDK